jgi:SAM-dependent methyltransferase
VANGNLPRPTGLTYRPAMSTDVRAERRVHLVGSIPLGSPDEVFSHISSVLGDRIERLPDGETGPRSDWIVWQYPVLSSRPEFEICPPGEHPYRSLPRLRLRDGTSMETLEFGDLGYAQAALASFRTFARLKRDGIIPSHVRFQVSLPTPLSPITAFIARDDQAAVEPAYEAALADELGRILRGIPASQLAIQWDANFEFAMLDAMMPSWFDDVRAGVVERLLRLAQYVPGDVQLGFHFCHDHERLRHDRPYDARRMVEVANALAAVMSRPLNWLHIPVPGGRLDLGFFEKLAPLHLGPETELYLGLVHLDEGDIGVAARITAAERYLSQFGIATECGWGRHRTSDLDELIRLHREASTPAYPSPRSAPAFQWPAGFDRIPDEKWTTDPVDDFGLAYDHVDQHSWYSNLDPTVAELADTLRDGDILLDYSGGTGILLDRLKLRFFDGAVGTIIADSSPKFLRVALEKFRDDPRVGLRVLRYLKEERRLQRVEEVLGQPMLDRGIDIVACTNAIHLYPDLPDTLRSWHGVLRVGGRVLVNSGNIRNPRARKSEWILDETVWVVADLAEGIVRSHPDYSEYRPLLDDRDRMKAHGAFRDQVFLAPRPLEEYVAAFTNNGFRVESVREASIDASVQDWYEFLTAYHGAVLGWVGGTEKIDGAAPTDKAVADRLRLMRHAMELLFGHRPTFQACWTYLTCVKDAAE